MVDKYDALCIIDADLFMYTNVRKYFDMVAEGKFVTAQNVRYCTIDKWTFGDLDALSWGKPDWALADFPTFFNPKIHKQFMLDWIDWHGVAVEGKASVSGHPCGAMNRSVCKNIKKEDIVVLDGRLWVADFQVSKYEVAERDNKLIYLNGPSENQQICAVHNRWWSNRAEADLRGAKSIPYLFLRSMNSIVEFMNKFNNRKLGQYVNSIFRKGLITHEGKTGFN